jgi:ubiquinone/menaquinone biosynthesis C-methylase UbiE
VKAVDVSADAVSQAKARFVRPNLTFHRMDAQALDFADASFDVVCAFEVIEHVDNWSTCLDELKRVLKRGGTAFLSTPNRLVASPGSPTPLNPYHQHEFSRRELGDALADRFAAVELLGEFEDDSLKTVKRTVTWWRARLHALDRLGARRLVPVGVRRAVLAAIVKVRSGGELRSVTTKNIVFSSEHLDEAPTFFATVRK